MATILIRNDITTESVDLVHLDPPFNSNKSCNVLFAHKETGAAAEAQIEAFGDTWLSATLSHCHRSARSAPRTGSGSGAVNAVRLNSIGGDGCTVQPVSVTATARPVASPRSSQLTPSCAGPAGATSARRCYVGAVSLGYTAAGKRRRRKVYGRTKAEVRDGLKTLRTEIETGVTSSARHTVTEAVRKWLDVGLRDRDPATVDKCRSFAENHIVPAIGASSCAI